MLFRTSLYDNSDIPVLSVIQLNAMILALPFMISIYYLLKQPKKIAS